MPVPHLAPCKFTLSLCILSTLFGAFQHHLMSCGLADGCPSSHHVQCGCCSDKVLLALNISLAVLSWANGPTTLMGGIISIRLGLLMQAPVIQQYLLKQKRKVMFSIFYSYIDFSTRYDLCWKHFVLPLRTRASSIKGWRCPHTPDQDGIRKSPDLLFMFESCTVERKLNISFQ